MLCVFSVFLASVAVIINLFFILFVTVHRKTNFFVNLYWDNKDSDSDSLIIIINPLSTSPWLYSP